MKFLFYILLIGLFAFAFFVTFKAFNPPLSFTQKSTMKLESPAYADGGVIPETYTCKGKNIHPPLTISGIPDGTVSLAITFEDLDTPLQVFDHWLVWNIAPQNYSISEGFIPSEAIQGTNSFGYQNYGGPCPPTGQHHYVFKVFALETSITLPEEATKKDLIEVMRGHILGQTQLTGVFP